MNEVNALAILQAEICELKKLLSLAMQWNWLDDDIRECVDFDLFNNAINRPINMDALNEDRAQTLEHVITDWTFGACGCAEDIQEAADSYRSRKSSMDLDDAIAHAKEKAGSCKTACEQEHATLAEWLEELKMLRQLNVKG